MFVHLASAVWTPNYTMSISWRVGFTARHIIIEPFSPKWLVHDMRKAA